jgi:hypothetical protein
MQAYFDVCIPGKAGELALSEVEAYRLLCHALVQQLPDAAYGEAIEALTGMYEFYQQVPTLPEPRRLSEPVKAKLTGSYTAPVYPVTEE